MTTLMEGVERHIADSLEESDFGIATPFRGKKRLSLETRALAARYLSGEIGRTVRRADFAVAPDFLEANKSADREVAEAIRLTATSSKPPV